MTEVILKLHGTEKRYGHGSHTRGAYNEYNETGPIKCSFRIKWSSGFNLLVNSLDYTF